MHRASRAPRGRGGLRRSSRFRAIRQMLALQTDTRRPQSYEKPLSPRSLWELSGDVTSEAISRPSSPMKCSAQTNRALRFWPPAAATSRTLSLAARATLRRRRRIAPRALPVSRRERRLPCPESSPMTAAISPQAKSWAAASGPLTRRLRLRVFTFGRVAYSGSPQSASRAARRSPGVRAACPRSS